MRNEPRKRIMEAYFTMAEKARYRPFAPGDGIGSLDLTEEELKPPRVFLMRPPSTRTTS
jgi:hypothetical protein